MGKLYRFHSPRLYVVSLAAYRVVDWRLGLVEANHDVRIEEACSRRQARESALVHAASRWPTTASWSGHGVETLLVRPEQVSDLMASSIFVAGLQALRVTDQFHNPVDHRHSAFLLTAENEQAARTEGSVKIRADCPESKGWRQHNIITLKLTPENIRMLFEESDLCIH